MEMRAAKPPHLRYNADALGENLYFQESAMCRHSSWPVAAALFLALIAGGKLGAADDSKAKARAYWENVVMFYGDEETGEWSLRIRDKDVHNRAWFEFLEL